MKEYHKVLFFFTRFNGIIKNEFLLSEIDTEGIAEKC